MRNRTIILIVNILLILLIQIFLLNNVLLFNRFHPYLYLLIILMLPAGVNKNIVMLSGFAIGFVIDIFSYTFGMHAAATTILAFLRPFVLSFLFESDDENRNSLISPQLLSYRVFIIYILTLLFIHHFILFMIEAGGFSNFGRTFSVIIVSVIFSSILILIYELFMQIRRS